MDLQSYNWQYYLGGVAKSSFICDKSENNKIIW